MNPPTEARVAAHLIKTLRAEGPPAALKLQARMLGEPQQDITTVDTHALTVEDADGFARQMVEAAYAMVTETRISTTFALLGATEDVRFPEFVFPVRLRDVLMEQRTRPALALRQQPEGQVFEGEIVENDMEGGYGFNGEPPTTRHIASNLALHALHALQANQELMISSARQQRQADAIEL